MTRAVLKETTPPTSATANYVLAWKSPEVRNYWYRRLSERVQQISAILYIVLQSRGIDRLQNNRFWTGINSSLASPQSDVEGPNLSSIFVKEADKFEKGLAEIEDDIAPLVNGTISSLQRSADRRTRLYRTLFVMGAALSIAAKIVGWRVARSQDSGSRKGPTPIES